MRAIEVDIVRAASGRIDLQYRVQGSAERIIWPPSTASTRVDHLWETTCFELFVKAQDRAAYHEFNFAPSRQWAAYRFFDMRQAMQIAQTPPPVIEANPMGLSASIDLGGVPGLAPTVDWSVALAAVIEQIDGAKSYWALRHPPGKPDFHHPDCFAFILAPPVRP